MSPFCCSSRILRRAGEREAAKGEQRFGLLLNNIWNPDVQLGCIDIGKLVFDEKTAPKDVGSLAKCSDAAKCDNTAGFDCSCYDTSRPLEGSVGQKKALPDP